MDLCDVLKFKMNTTNVNCYILIMQSGYDNYVGDTYKRGI